MRKRPYDAPAGRMSDAQFAATCLELRRVVLGGRPERPELVPSRAEIVTFERQRRHPDVRPNVRPSRS